LKKKNPPPLCGRRSLSHPSSSEASCSLQAHRRGDNAVSGNSLSDSLPLAGRDISGVALISSASAALTPAACSRECLMGVMPRGARGRPRLGGLPDDLLLCLMSFLPSRDAARTCVLARRWCSGRSCLPSAITPATARYFSVPSALGAHSVPSDSIRPE
jgi:hypothetical protein